VTPVDRTDDVTDLAPLQLQQRHNRALLAVMLERRHVFYRDAPRLLRTLLFQQSGGGIKTDVYLEGLAESVDPDLITFVGDSGHHSEPCTADSDAQHSKVLLHALQTAHPVVVASCNHFIHTIVMRDEGPGVSFQVYLTGQSRSVAPAAVSLKPNHAREYPFGPR